MPLTVVDARGNGGGWRITLTTSNAVSSGPGAMIVSGARAACIQTCTLPSNALGYPIQIAADGSSSDVFGAAPSTGMGAIDVDLRIAAQPASGGTLLISLTEAAGP